MSFDRSYYDYLFLCFLLPKPMGEKLRCYLTAVTMYRDVLRLGKELVSAYAYICYIC